MQLQLVQSLRYKHFYAESTGKAGITQNIPHEKSAVKAKPFISFVQNWMCFPPGTSRIHLGLQNIRSCLNQAIVHWGACDPCTGYPEQVQAGAVLCHTVLHVLLGLQNHAVLYISLKPKLNWLIVMEKPGGRSHLAPVMMPPACPCLYLERKQHILLLRKSYKNFEDHNAGESRP